MAVTGQLRCVGVADLRHGLYVVEPDRPWTEVPLMFQGFEITTDDELEVLRTFCKHVYVDVERSAAEAVDALPVKAAGPGSSAGDDPAAVETGVTTQRPETDTASAFGPQRYPDTGRFERLLRRAWESRSQTRRFVEALFEADQPGAALDQARGRAVISDLLQTVTANPGAAIWLSNLDERDAPTSVHSVNVCILALTFGAHLGLERAELERIGLGALLHDIGKLSMPPDIRNKPDALTDAEWDIARQHPEDGYEILRDRGDFPGEVLDIVRMHHERLDGRGYPVGHAGVELPLHVRVVALANAYDARTSPRVYREATPADRVLQSLYNDADATFGGRLVQEFIRCVGIYPSGSLVELDNGAVGVVLGSRPDARIQPTVLLVRTPDGEFHRRRVVLNLAAEAERGGPAPARHIRRALDPADEGIDVGGIMAIEFGLDAVG